MGRTWWRTKSQAWPRVGAVVAGIVLVAVSVGLGISTGRDSRADLDLELGLEVDRQVSAIEEYFDRASDIVLLQAQNAALAGFYTAPGGRSNKIIAGSPILDEAARSLGYLEKLYSDRIGEICFIDQSGAENVRIVHGTRALVAELSADEASNPFFAPTFALGVGQVYQAAAYTSPDTHDLVVSNSTVVPGLPAGQRAIIHFEVTVDSFTRVASHPDFDLTILDANTGKVLSGGARSWPSSGRPSAADGRALATLVSSGRDNGVITIGGLRVAFDRLDSSASNASEWFIIGSAPALDDGTISSLGPWTMILIGAAFALFVLAVASFHSYQRRLKLAATTDGLTSLPNRDVLCDEVEQALVLSQRRGGKVAVLVLDLDRFKEVNDTLGHHCGDQLLAAIGPRIRAWIRDGDTIARLGGDEFAIVMPVSTATEAMEVAQRIHTRMRDAFHIGDRALEIEASIGVAIAPQHGKSFAELLQHADMAMYVAKRSGAGVSLYEPVISAQTTRQPSLSGELRRAIEIDELVLYYQPKVLLPSEELHSVEALIRWNHPERGLTPPGEFVPLVEHTSLIHPLTDWVIERAVHDIRVWLDRGREISVSINVSARSLNDHRLCESIADRLDWYRVPSRLLAVEITETAIMAEQSKSREVLVALRAMGVELSIDDFGTGYSSLAHLTKLPINELKIDRSFVTNMNSHSDDAVVVRSIIDLGHNLGLRVVAEGVEDRATRDRLVDVGCQFGQGYLWSAPLSSGALNDWIDDRLVAASASALVECPCPM